MLDPQTFVGRAPEQTRKFIKESVASALGEAELKDVLEDARERRVELTV